MSDSKILSASAATSTGSPSSSIVTPSAQLERPRRPKLDGTKVQTSKRKRGLILPKSYDAIPEELLDLENIGDKMEQQRVLDELSMIFRGDLSPTRLLSKRRTTREREISDDLVSDESPLDQLLPDLGATTEQIRLPEEPKKAYKEPESVSIGELVETTKTESGETKTASKPAPLILNVTENDVDQAIAEALETQSDRVNKHIPDHTIGGIQRAKLTPKKLQLLRQYEKCEGQVNELTNYLNEEISETIATIKECMQGFVRCSVRGLDQHTDKILNHLVTEVDELYHLFKHTPMDPLQNTAGIVSELFETILAEETRKISDPVKRNDMRRRISASYDLYIRPDPPNKENGPGVQ